MQKNNIALIGFMATGKTTIGRKLVEVLDNDYKLVETDDIIIQKAGKSIPEIFREDGEIRFREYEIAVCKEISDLRKVIISCGGGVVLNKINIDYLRKNAFIVLLNATPEVIYQRVKKDGEETRPVLYKNDVKHEIEKVLKFREPFYNVAADIIIDTTNKSIDKIVQVIMQKTKINKSVFEIEG
ncbi:MAG: AAA family ATPase [Candidatus Lokiarchaeota archaeon]|nr:AAA family ATPase [Candidatus Lokiarchaeota archaeon]MBD3200597.1 AAA family ATPase [Candidatus Lokiarchaeota archaeon]